MKCGVLKIGLLVLALALPAHSCLSPAYGQATQKNDEVLLDELEQIIDAQESRILQLESELQQSKSRMAEFESLSEQSAKALREANQLLAMQSETLAAQKPLFENYARASGAAALEAGLIGGASGLVLGFVGGIISMYYLGTR